MMSDGDLFLIGEWWRNDMREKYWNGEEERLEEDGKGKLNLEYWGVEKKMEMGDVRKY